MWGPGCNPWLFKDGACPSERGAAGTTPAQVRTSLIGAGMVLLGAFPIGDAFAALGGLFKGADIAATATEDTAAGSGNLVIGKVADLQAPGALGPGERTLLDRLTPDLGSPQANWARNAGVLRDEMANGAPIRDASVNPVTGALQNDTGFLRAERYLLQDRGWAYDPKTTLWSLP